MAAKKHAGGRPRREGSPMRVITLRMDDETLADLEKIGVSLRAKLGSVSMAQLVRAAIRETAARLQAPPMAPV